MRAFQAVSSAGRLVQLKRCTPLCAGSVMRLSTNTPPVIKPEDIIHDCSTIRESIQALNDVGDAFHDTITFLSLFTLYSSTDSSAH
jgi:hypothetical protein